MNFKKILKIKKTNSKSETFEFKKNSIFEILFIRAKISALVIKGFLRKVKMDYTKEVPSDSPNGKKLNAIQNVAKKDFKIKVTIELIE